MQKTVNRIAFKVKHKAEKTIRAGHPWVYDKSIVKQSKEGEAGDLAIIFDSKKDKFLACGLYDPDSPIRIKLIQFKESLPIDDIWFENIIQKAVDKRKAFDESQTNAYRLIYGENDGLPGLIVDRYADSLVVKFYSAIWFPYKELIFQRLMSTTPCSNLIVRFSRNVMKAATEAGMEEGKFIVGDGEEVVEFIENELKFKTNLVKGHKTGFFLDHRKNRIEVEQLAKELNVLDVFSYIGGFAIHALAGGAESATCVDVSEKALEVAIENAELNGIEENLRTLPGDAFEILKELRQRGRMFEMIIIDPPSFAKKKDEKEKAIVQYRRLVKLALPILNEDGILVMASCSSRVKKEEFFEFIEDELKLSGRKFVCFKRHFHDLDHPIKIPEASYLKCGYFKVH